MLAVLALLPGWVWWDFNPSPGWFCSSKQGGSGQGVPRMALPPRGAGLVPLVPWVFLAARSVRREPALWDGLAPPELWFCWHTEGNCLPWSCVAPLFCPRPLQLPACSAAGDCGHCAGSCPA